MLAVAPQASPPSRRRASPVDIVARLAKFYGDHKGAGPATPFEMIFWKNIGYLIDDERRAALFAEFKERVGGSAAEIAAADPATLMDIAKRGGMRPEARVQKWRRIAALTIDRAEGDLNQTLRKLPLVKAIALLRAFPSIGEPGADEILLISGIDARPSLESNGLRAMLRLGLCKEGANYSASYRAAASSLMARAARSRDRLILAFHVLRLHGQTLCKRSAPKCTACPVADACPRIALKGSY